MPRRTPEPPSEFHSFRRYDYDEGCRAYQPLVALRCEMARLGCSLEDPYKSILEAVEEQVSDGIMASGAGGLFDTAAYNHEALRARTAREGVEAQPRIEIVTTINVRGYLKVYWLPLGYCSGLYCGPIDPDFRRFSGSEYGGYPNELASIPEVKRLPRLLEIPSSRGFHASVNSEIVAGYLVAALRGMVHDIVRDLKPYFLIKVRNDFQIDTVDEEPDDRCSWRKLKRITGWHLYDVADRQKRRDEDWIAGFEARHGVSLETFRDLAAGVSREAAVKKLRPVGMVATRGSSPEKLPITGSGIEAVEKEIVLLVARGRLPPHPGDTHLYWSMDPLLVAEVAERKAKEETVPDPVVRPPDR
jgi:hypothetical protein